MSRLIVITRPFLATGFHLAGVEAYPAEAADRVEDLIAGWLEDGEQGLVAIEETLLEGLDAALRRRLEASTRLQVIAIPGDGTAAPAASRQQRLAEMLRRAIGFQIRFGGEESNA